MASHLTAATDPSTASQPIGLFDSGIGGLTVLKAISTRLPREDLLYLGDTARLPYGTKSRETIIRYTLKAAQKGPDPLPDPDSEDAGQTSIEDTPTTVY